MVFGTRLEAIKIAPVIKELKNCQQFETLVCVTGQHREMLDQVLDIFDIHPDYDLNIMSPGQDLYDITSKVLLGMREVLKACHPDLVCVHGDTTTSTAAALSAFYYKIKVAHIEAGLRTNNMYSPWPEEINRQLTTRIAHFHFAPTDRSRDNLLLENISSDKIFVTGNTVIDALLMVVQRIKENDRLAEDLTNQLLQNGYNTSRLESNRRLVLITGHRRENFGQGFINICNSIKDLAKKFPKVDFVYPMHLNPNVRTPIHEVFGHNLDNLGNIFFIEPLEYLEFVYLMEKSYLILTDSGGIQEEAPSLGKPVLVMRNTTERPEAIDAGTVKLVGTDYESITSHVCSLLENSNNDYQKMHQSINPYGDGKASYRISKFLIEHLN